MVDLSDLKASHSYATGQMHERAAEHERYLAQHHKDIQAIREKAGKEFPKAAELKKKQDRLKHLESEMAAPEEMPQSEENVSATLDTVAGKADTTPVEPQSAAPKQESKMDATKTRKSKEVKLNLAAKSPTKFDLVKENEDGTRDVVVGRPQVGPHQFATYAPGDIITESLLAPHPTMGFMVNAGTKRWVVTAAKKAAVRSGEGYKVWDQQLTTRPATDEDLAAVAQQQAASDAETKRVMDSMMSR